MKMHAYAGAYALKLLEGHRRRMLYRIAYYVCIYIRVMGIADGVKYGYYVIIIYVLVDLFVCLFVEVGFVEVDGAWKPYLLRTSS